MKRHFTLLFSLLFFISLPLAAQMKVGDKAKGKASIYHDSFNGKKTASGEVYRSSLPTCAHLTLPYGTMIKVTNLTNRKSITLKVNDRGPFVKGRLVEISFKAASVLNMIKLTTQEVEIEVLSLGDGAVASKEETPKKAVASPEKEKTTAKSSTKTASSTKQASTKTTTSAPVKPANFVAGKTYNVWGTPISPNGYGVQIGSFEYADDAVQTGKEAIDLGLDNMYVQCGWENGKRIYRVIYGAHASMGKAEASIKNASAKGFKNNFVQVHFNK